MHWDEATLSTVQAAVDRARAGQPTVFFVEGEAGAGKTALLDELVSRAPGFHVLAAAASERATTPYDTLDRLGVAVPRTADGSFPGPFFAAQQVRAILDGAGDEPVLLRVDDLHWADPESVRALLALFERASGDRLLVAAAARTGEAHPEWLHWVDRSTAVLRLRLTGLDFLTAVRLARHRRPDLDAATIRLLWEHTAGNPLYLSALVAEHDDRALRRARVLPAPAAFADAVRSRVARTGPDAQRLVQAVAVLGPSTVPLYVAAEIADVDDPDTAAQALADAALVQLQETDTGVELQLAHALVRSAVYDGIALPERRRLHARAAELLGDGGGLEHRVAAASRFDAELATELVTAGWASYRQQLSRQGAQRLRWASTLTADPRLREARRLDALFLSVMQRDFALVRDELEALTSAGAPESPRQAAVAGAYALLRGHVAEASAMLETALEGWPDLPDGAADADGDEFLRYRLEALLAWARIGGGNSTEFLDGLALAVDRGLVDPALVGFVGFAQGLARVREQGAEAELDRLAPLPQDPVDVPLRMSFVLGWRGLLELVLGLFDRSLADQAELLRRVNAGLVSDTAAGGIGAYLATSYWSIGEWDLARLHFRMAAESGQATGVAPLLALFALEPASRGDTRAADEWMTRAELAAEGGLWPETPQNLVMARVVRLRAHGTAAERAELLPELQQRWPAALRGRGLIGVPWLSYTGLAAVWAGQVDLARELVDRMRSGSPRPPWTAAVAGWITGLVAEADGDPAAALEHLERAATLAPAPPLQRSYLLDDLLRLRADRGVTVDDGLAAEADRLFRGLGAARTPLSAPLPAAGAQSIDAPATPAPAPAGGPGPVPAGDVYGLSDRERDVVTLLASGMSYEQIARELFITRSTVGFHLGRVYAKAGVGSRHELTALLRSDPASFGLTGAGR
ncbi:helix-turn-helix transcriptional regulator [Nakamurella endophytica]|uniref:LuxR family transcriptional regulator n=1 Tax=Nakamurella endophytica TaxID=1748367 RepID=A0A917WEK2_9ACTN|nr:LuxR C-terminal-related transcriptional regulator [Nakamurella endophytica]GGL98336.1 LuxR family transcriptional regulator [Nakamurella endophytica]